MKRNKPLVRRKRINPVSEKRIEMLAIYREVAKKYFLEHPMCEVCETALSEQIHHIAGRTGNLLIDPTNFMAVCAMDHSRIHCFPAWAREKGYRKSPTAPFSRNRSTE